MRATWSSAARATSDATSSACYSCATRRASASSTSRRRQQTSQCTRLSTSRRRTSLCLPCSQTRSPPTGVPPRVVFHTTVLIRFWERHTYTQAVSHRVTVRGGTGNVLRTVQALPEPPIMVYMSTADVGLPRPRLIQLGKDYETLPRDCIVFGDGDAPLAAVQAPDGCYACSKMQAEELVRHAHGECGLRTGILRLVQTIVGPNDRLLMSMLTRPRVPVFDCLPLHCLPLEHVSAITARWTALASKIQN